MADNVSIGSTKTSAVIATDDVGGIQYQVAKFAHGVDGAATLVSSSSGLPVTPRDSSGVEIAPATQATVASILAKIIAAPATEAKQDSAITQITALSTVMGTRVDAKSTATDGTSVSQMQVIKQISASAQSINTVLGTTAWTLGSGAVAATTLRTISATDDPIITAIQGNVAHDAADSGNGSKIAAKAVTALSTMTAVAALDRTDLYSDLDGALITRNRSAHGDLVSGSTSNTDGASSALIAAGSTSVKHYITDVTITNTSTTNIYVELKDGTTVKWNFPVPAGGGVCKSFLSPLAGSANTAWNFDPSAATSTIYCSASAYKSKV